MSRNLDHITLRMTGHAAIEKHLDFHTSILRASRSRRVFGYEFRLTVTHGRYETT